MDLIYTNQDREDVGVLTGYELDLAFGADENNLECRVQSGNHCCESGSLLYMEGTEFGGIIDSIESETDTEEVIYRGRTWHGILNSKVIQPDDGQAYLTVSGDANTVIGSLLSKLALTDLFEVSSEVSGLTISNYKMNRYITGYDGILKMLDTVGGKLKMYFNGSKVVLYATERHDFTQDEEFDADLVAFNAKRNYKGVNHLICLGSGQLEERMVVHLYADTEGNISQTQTQFGLDEVCAIYEYSNVETVEELIQEGTDKLESIKAADEISIDFDVDSDVYDVGDIIGAVDNITGLTAYATIAKKIVTIVDGEISVRLSPDTAKAGSSYELGGGSGGGGLTAHASTHAAGGSDPLTPAAIGAVQSQVFVIYTAEQTLLEYITEKINEGYTSGVIQIFGAQLSDVPTSVGTYALVTYQKHADNYVMVSLVTDGGVDIRVRKFIFLQTDWHTTDWVLMYSTNNKPTPADIGAVSKSGDTMTGDFYIDKNTPGLWMMDSDSDVKGVIQVYNNNSVGLFVQSKDGKNGYNISMNRNNPVKTSLRYTHRVDGVNTTYNIYGEHNKPTPDEIGAFGVLPIQSDLNNFMSIGCARADGNTLNRPANASSFGIVWNFTDTQGRFVAQNYFDTNNQDLYFRYRVDAGWFDWVLNYTEFNKPTPADIGAVSKAGDTMTGALTFKNSDAFLAVTKARTNNNIKCQLSIGVGAAANGYNGTCSIEYLEENTIISRINLAEDGMYFSLLNGASSKARVFGEHNKPTGTYTGTGSSTSQTKTIGGIGKALLITSDYAVGIVTQHGALFGRVSSTTSAYSTFIDTEIKFVDGVLTIAESSSYFNGSSYTYTYQVL